MLEILINSPFSTVVSSSGATALSDLVLYKDGSTTSVTPTAVRVGTTDTWTVSFTPTETGVFEVHAFGLIQIRVLAVQKLSRQMIANVENEALGSWSWNKQTGVLTLVTQTGDVFATFTVEDTLTNSSRERVS